MSLSRIAAGARLDVGTRLSERQDDIPAPAAAGGVLLVTAVPLMRRGDAILLDDQTCEGLERWAEHFDRITYVGIDAADAKAGAPESSITWRDVGELSCADRLEVLVLPRAYRVKEFLTAVGPARALLSERIRTSRHLCFTLGALVGDWGAVAAIEAMRQSRRYAVWFDRVEHEVVRASFHAMSTPRRLKEALTLPIMERFHRHLIGRSALGLFQGQDTFKTYAPFSGNPFCVYDTHTREEDKISPAALDAKVERALSGAPLRICYVGRAAEMKGPADWVRTLGLVRDAGVDFSAAWLGDGPLLGAMGAQRTDLGLVDRIELAGFQSDRQAVLAKMRATDLFVFCHKTPESPRCLVEALVSGSPLFGYRSAYASELTAGRGGGVFSAVGDPPGLADLIVQADRDRGRLARLMRDAAAAGSRFDEATVYRERCALIRRHL